MIYRVVLKEFQMHCTVGIIKLVWTQKSIVFLNPNLDKQATNFTKKQLSETCSIQYKSH